MERLNCTRCQVAPDDFGAGYNAVTYLHELPVQIMKLDRSLTVGAERAGDHRPVLASRCPKGATDDSQAAAIPVAARSGPARATMHASAPIPATASTTFSSGRS
jgi:hypothetical protein